MSKQVCLAVKGTLYVVGIALAVYIAVDALDLIIDHILK